MKRKVLVFTGNRAEYGLQLPVIKSLQNSKKVKCKVMVSGSHLDKRFGNTINEIKKDKLKIGSKIKLTKPPNLFLHTPYLISDVIRKVSKELMRLKPNIFLINADRYETFGACVASTQINIPTFHIEGGDRTEGGVLDDSVRHAITKLSHIHFATNTESYKNIINLGEEKWRVFNVGLPINDTIRNTKFLNFETLKKKFNINNKKPLILFTQHPVTTEPFNSGIQIKTSLKVLKKMINRYDCNVIATYPNSDVGSDEIVNELQKFKNSNNNFQLIKSLGNLNYHSLMNLNKSLNVCVVGNSSSGIKESIAFNCPTVNIGSRQDGRLKPGNVINSKHDENDIEKKIKIALFDRKFKKYCKKAKNPYFKKNTSKLITSIIEDIELDKKILRKKLSF